MVIREGSERVEERTGGQMAIGVTSISFGVMGVAMSALLFAFGPALAADMASGVTAHHTPTYTLKLPANDAISLWLELALLAAWIALIVAGAGVLQFKSWSRPASILSGAAITLLCAAKIFEGGFSYSALGFATFGAVLLAVFLRSDWKQMSARERDERDIEHILLEDELRDKQARRAA